MFQIRCNRMHDVGKGSMHIFRDVEVMYGFSCYCHVPFIGKVKDYGFLGVASEEYLQ